MSDSQRLEQSVRDMVRDMSADKRDLLFKHLKDTQNLDAKRERYRSRMMEIKGTSVIGGYIRFNPIVNSGITIGMSGVIWLDDHRPEFCEYYLSFVSLNPGMQGREDVIQNLQRMVQSASVEPPF